MTVSAQLHDVATASLGGLRALVTGGSRGICAGIVQRLAADGVAVALTYREARGPANNLEQEIIGSGGQTFAVQADNEDPEALRRAITETVERFGGLEVLVNNAGTSHLAPTKELSLAPAFAPDDSNGHYVRIFVHGGAVSFMGNPRVVPPPTWANPYALPGENGGAPWTDASEAV